MKRYDMQRLAKLIANSGAVRNSLWHCREGDGRGMYKWSTTDCAYSIGAHLAPVLPGMLAECEVDE
jgi:hypothetical protein